MTSMTRRNFVSGAAAGASAMGLLGVIASGSAQADAQLVYTTKDWKVTGFDDLAKGPQRIKQAYDVTGVNGGAFLNNIKNSLNGLHFGFGIPDNEIRIAACLHGPANMLNYDDYIWKKYEIGAWLHIEDPATQQPATRNPYYLSKAGPNLHYSSESPDSYDSIYQDSSIQALQHRGVQFLSCHTATEEQARAIIRTHHLQQQPEEIVKDMLAHLLPNVMVVASMVAALALLQTEGHFSYLKV